MRRSDFDFALPEELIAQHPLGERSASRLLHCAGDALVDLQFTDLPGLLKPSDLLVFNDTRVINARLVGRKESGGRIELLVERIEGERGVRAQLSASHAPKPGAKLFFGDTLAPATATVIARDEDFYTLSFDCEVAPLLAVHGTLPLPPYITHAPDATDSARYQTVFAREPGAVAAPTAGLHFDAAVLDALAGAGIASATLTLHVGAGTFVPVRVEDLSEHVMHAERYVVPQTLVEAIAAARARGGRVVAVGTTSLRALESASDDSGTLRAGAGETRLFITPGYRFKVVDALLTNFHLPKSTLLMLVSAFAGVERMRTAYRHAIEARYRFFSYGDAMLIDPLRHPR